MRRRLDPERTRSLLENYRQGADLTRADLIALGRGLLEELASRAPGRSVEIRIPFVGATQIIAGPRHTRGTPPSVIEMELEAWLALASGAITWADGLASGTVAASGQRVDISEYLPLG